VPQRTSSIVKLLLTNFALRYKSKVGAPAAQLFTVISFSPQKTGTNYIYFSLSTPPAI
jgi:hypothetical protein